MTSSPAHAGTRFCLDTRLMAEVQTRSGARVHESAGLLYTYRLCANCYRLTLTQGDVLATAEARQDYEQSEMRLRRFLAGTL